MRRLALLAAPTSALAVSALVAAALAAPAGASAVPAAVRAQRPTVLSRAQTSAVHADLLAGKISASRGVRAACGNVKLQCRSIVVTKSPGSQSPLDSFFDQIGYGAAELTSAYGLKGAPAGHGTIALVETGNYPNLESDLTIYRDFNKLPDCTVAAKCLTVVNKTGGTTLPTIPKSDEWRFANEDVAVETALDVDMASAACPRCKIVVVDLPIKDAFEADSDAKADAQYVDFGTGVQTAVKLKADAVSLSYGLPISKYADTGSRAAAFNVPGVAVYASSGDDGVEYSDPEDPEFSDVSWPQNLRTVISAGGTSLYQSGKGWSQAAWQQAGSSCSYDLARAVGQPKSVGKVCDGHRVGADVSAVADPFTGVSVYDSYAPGSGEPYGFIMVGGTSASAPFLAGMNARAGVAKGTVGPNAVYHAAAGTTTDITVGANAVYGECPSENDRLCDAVTGWDGPTGVGTPHGLGAFAHTS